jgi:hypothetical protein
MTPRLHVVSAIVCVACGALLLADRFVMPARAQPSIAPSEPVGTYQIVQMDNGRAWRINTRTGATSACWFNGPQTAGCAQLK